MVGSPSPAQPDPVTQANTEALLQLTSAVLRTAGMGGTALGQATLTEQRMTAGRATMAAGRGTAAAPSGGADLVQIVSRSLLGTAGAKAVSAYRKDGAGAAVSKGATAAAEGLSKLVSPAAVLVGLFGKLAGVLGPLAIIGATLGSASSGFGVLVSSVKLLGATLGPILLPVVAVLAAGFVALSGWIWDRILPALGDYYASIVGGAMDAVDVLSAAFETAKTLVVAFAEGLWETGKGVAKGFTQAVDMVHKGMQAGVDAIVAMIKSLPGGERILGGFKTANDALQSNGITPDSVGKLAVGMATGGLGRALGGELMEGIGAPVAGLFKSNLDRSRRETAEGGGMGGRFGAALKDVLRQLQHDTGSKAESSGIVEQSRKVQLALLNQSPFEAETLKRQQESLAKLQEVVNNLQGIRANTKKGAAD